MSSKSPESASAVEIQEKNLERTSLLFCTIFNQCLKDNDQFEFLLNRGTSYEAKWAPRNSVPEEAIYRYFAGIRREMPER